MMMLWASVVSGLGIILLYDLRNRLMEQHVRVLDLFGGCYSRFSMDDQIYHMEEYIRLEEEKAQRHGRTFNWQTATYGKMEYYEDEDDNDMIELPKSQPKKTYNKYLKCEMVMVKVPRYMSRLDAYDEPIVHLNVMEDEAENPTPQSTPQVLPSFEVYTQPVTYPEEVKETIGIPMEVEPLNQTQLEDLGLNTCSHDLSFSSKEIPSVNEPEPQLLPNSSPLDIKSRRQKRNRPTHQPI
ncbi:hypothetical protein Tco_0898044 [Tanacetum coccineum]